MFVSFDLIPNHARIWVFQANQPFSDTQEKELQLVAESFVENWTAHNRDLKASFSIVDHLFLIFTVDESAVGASGCSLDKLHQFIKGREQAMQLNLLNRLLVAIPGIEQASVYKLSEFTDRIEKGEFSGNQIVYDCTITTREEFTTRFRAPLSQTWLSRYLPS